MLSFRVVNRKLVQFPAPPGSEFHPVHIVVRELEQGIVRDLLMGIGHADAHGKLAIRIFIAKRGGHGFPDAPGDVQRLGARRDILHEGDEFIPARAGHKIPGTERFLQQLGESDQHGVAAQVAIAIVDALEMIEIEHQQGGRMPSAVDIQIRLDKLLRVLAVVEPRERIEPGLADQLVLPHFAFGDVEEQADAHGLSFPVHNEPPLFKDPDDLPVPLSDAVFLLIAAVHGLAPCGAEKGHVIGANNGLKAARHQPLENVRLIAEEMQHPLADVGQAPLVASVSNEKAPLKAGIDQRHKITLAAVVGLTALLLVNVGIEAVQHLMAVPPLFRAAGVQAHPYVAAVLPADAERDAEPPGGFAVADLVVAHDQIFGIHKVDGAIAELAADFFPRIPDHTEKLIIGLKDGVLGIGGELCKTVEHHGVAGFQFGVLFLERNHALLKLLLELMGAGDVDDDADDNGPPVLGNIAQSPVKDPNVGPVPPEHPIGDFIAVSDGHRLID